MKSLITIAITIFTLGLIQPAVAGQCQVTYQKCDFEIGGFCVKWNSKAQTINARDAQYFCDDIRQVHFSVRRCDTSACQFVRRPHRRVRWELQRGNGRFIQGFGRGRAGKQDCRRELRYRQCNQGRNPHARCVGIRRGQEVDSIEPICGRRGGLRWELQRGNGRFIQGFGRGRAGKQDCRRELRTRQCDEGRNPFARCVGLRNGTEQDSIEPICGRRHRRRR